MAKAQFELLSGRTSIARGPAIVGLFCPGDGSAVLIDSGNDAEAGKKILHALEDMKLTLSALVITHSNADHSGGAALLRERTGCRVITTRMEAAVMTDPILEPNLLWGARPPLPLHNKFLMAPPCPVTDIMEASERWTRIPGTDLDCVALPGHFLDMIGVMTPDRVFFCADTVASREILDKYSVFYLRDPELHLQTLRSLETHDADWFVPSHAEPTRDIKTLIALNEARILEIADLIVSFCAEPKSPDQTITAVARRFSLAMNHAQYALVGSTVRSYLSWLCDSGRLEARFDSGSLCCRRI